MARTGVIHRATREGAKARIALAGPAGSGKTRTALAIASVLAGDKGILLVDTEHREAQFYADDYSFDVFEWAPPFDPRELITWLKENGSQHGVIILDSVSHFYNGEGGLLSIVDIAGERVKGNTFAGWKVGTPIQNEMIETLRRLPCHVITTLRSKTDYVVDRDQGGRSTPRKIGLAPVQREGYEYEMGFIGDLDKEHNLSITKSRYSEVADKVYRAGHEKEFAVALRDWLQTAKPEEAQPTPALELSPADSATFAEAVAPKAKPVKAPAKAQPTPPAEHTTQNVTADRVSLMNAIIQRITVQFPGTPERNAFLAKHGHDGSGMYVRFIQAADMDAMKAMAVELGVYA
jgi:energy-coupling factor transporter ATP-binding protein EcfA2